MEYGQQEWQKIGQIALIDFVENFIEIVDHRLETLVVGRKASRTEILRKNVGARLQYDWLDGNGFIFRYFRFDIVDGGLHLCGDDVIQLIKS